jgi:hypothetical protein
VGGISAYVVISSLYRLLSNPAVQKMLGEALETIRK